jgi:hypothetical protein
LDMTRGNGDIEVEFRQGRSPQDKVISSPNGPNLEWDVIKGQVGTWVGEID